ncbi:DUF2889 domain-containing protein [soil metagenome]
MPLPSPEPREELHHREIQMRGYRRADGLFDIEGRITDRKPQDFKLNIGTVVRRGDAIHDMSVRVTIDVDYNVTAAVACSDATPYEICPTAAIKVQELVGLNMGRGWSRGVRERLQGTQGCTHIIELLVVLGTVGFQSLVPFRTDHTPSPTNTKPPRIIDTCLGWAADGQAVTMLWPQHARPPKTS